HHSAQKSTSTGTSLWSTAVSHWLSVTSAAWLIGLARGVEGGFAGARRAAHDAPLARPRPVEPGPRRRRRPPALGAHASLGAPRGGTARHPGRARRAALP